MSLFCTARIGLPFEAKDQWPSGLSSLLQPSYFCRFLVGCDEPIIGAQQGRLTRLVELPVHDIGTT
jgi:hypothetical protein